MPKKGPRGKTAAAEPGGQAAPDNNIEPPGPEAEEVQAEAVPVVDVDSALSAVLSAIAGLATKVDGVVARVASVEAGQLESAKAADNLQDAVGVVTGLVAEEEKRYEVRRQQEAADLQVAQALANDQKRRAGKEQSGARAAAGRKGQTSGGTTPSSLSPEPSPLAALCKLEGCERTARVHGGKQLEFCGAQHAEAWRNVDAKSGLPRCGFKGCARPVFVSRHSGIVQGHCKRDHAKRDSAQHPKKVVKWSAGNEQHAEAEWLLARSKAVENEEVFTGESPEAPHDFTDSEGAARDASGEGSTPSARTSTDPRDLQLAALTAQLAALAQQVLAAQTPTAAPAAAGVPAVPEGPFPPNFCDHLAKVCNPFSSETRRPVGTGLHPHIYLISEANVYFRALRKRRTQAYHEYQYLYTQLDFAWDRLAAWREFWASGEPDKLGDSGRHVVLSVYNSDLEAYNVYNRRRCILELRCRVNFTEIDSLPGDARILAAMEAKMEGFKNGYGNSAAIDPLFKQWAGEFEKSVAKAEFTASAKAAGAERAKYKGKGAPQGGAPKK